MEHMPQTLETLRLDLTVADHDVIRFLARFEEPERSERALEALKVGVIAIQSASPNLDARVVEEKFREVETSVDECLKDFKVDLNRSLEANFKPESGVVPRSLENVFGPKGTVSQVFDQYFRPDGKVSALLASQLGPASPFARSLDPNSKESVICKIEDSVDRRMREKVGEIINQFSLDLPDSALTRLKTCVSAEIESLKEENRKFFGELKMALGVKAGKQLEAERGTQKGRDFEESLYEYVATLARQVTDTTENVRSIAGSVPKSKVGDYVITLGDTCAGRDSRIVVEAKKKAGLKLRDAIEELQEAKKNREAASGIFAFEKNCSPPVEVGDFLRVGDDFFVSIDEQALENGEPLLFFEAAYKISRVMTATASRREQAQELDLGRIDAEVGNLVELTKRFSEILTKVRTISSNSKIIEEIAEKMKKDMESHLDSISRAIRGVAQPAPGEPERTPAVEP